MPWLVLLLKVVPAWVQRQAGLLAAPAGLPDTASQVPACSPNLPRGRDRGQPAARGVIWPRSLSKPLQTSTPAGVGCFPASPCTPSRPSFWDPRWTQLRGSKTRSSRALAHRDSHPHGGDTASNPGLADALSAPGGPTLRPPAGLQVKAARPLEQCLGPSSFPANHPRFPHPDRSTSGTIAHKGPDNTPKEFCMHFLLFLPKLYAYYFW